MTLSAHTKAALLAGAVAIVFSLGAAAGRGCAKPPPPKVVETTDTTEVNRRLLDEIARLKQTTKRKVTRAPVVDEKFDPKTGALVERKTSGSVTSSSESKVEAARNTHVVEDAARHAATSKTIEPAPPADPRLRLYLAGTWHTPGLELRPVASVGAEIRLIDRLSLDVRYAPPALNTDKHHNVSAELKLTVLEWR